MSGARLHLAPAELGTSLESLWGLVEAQRINVLQMPPSLLQALLPSPATTSWTRCGCSAAVAKR